MGVVGLGRRHGGQDGVVHARPRRQGARPRTAARSSRAPDEVGRPGPGRAQPPRLLQGRGEVGPHLQGDRRRALLDPGRLRPGRRRRLDPPARAAARSASTRAARRSSPKRSRRRSRPTTPCATPSWSGVPHRPSASRSWRWSSRRRRPPSPAEVELIDHVKDRLASLQGAPAGARASRRSAGRPTARSTTSGTGPSRSRSWRRRGGLRPSWHDPTVTDVRRPGRRHPRRGRVAPLRRSAPLRPPGRPGRPDRDSRSWCPRSSCSRATRCGCTWCGPTPSSGPWPRTPRVVLSVAGRLGLHPVDVEGDRRGGPARSASRPPTTARCSWSARHGARRTHARRAAWPRSCGASWRLPARGDRGRPGRGPPGEAARDPRDRDPGRAGAGQVQVRRQRRRGPPTGRGRAAAAAAARATRRRLARCGGAWTDGRQR